MKFPKLNIFNMNRNGKGVRKGEDDSLTLKNMPKLFFRKLTKLLSLNFPMLPLLLIPFIEAYLYVTANTMPSQTHPAFSSLFGLNTIAQTPGVTSLLGVFGSQFGLQTYDKLRYSIAIILIFIMAIIWGWINVGATYCARGMVKGDPVFITSDFFYAVKRNFWQGLLIGIIDFVCLAVLGFDLFYFSTRGGTLVLDFMFFALCAVLIIYMFMRYYMYMILVTFNIKTIKLFKNSLIFSILGIKRNLISLLGIVAVVGLNALLILLFWSIGLAWIAIPLILPAIYLMPTIVYFKAYGTWPIIEKYMID